MKIVINKCFGGFGLSPNAIKRYAELKGWECYFFKCDLKTEEYEEITIEEARSARMSLWSAFKVSNPAKHINRKKPWKEQSMEERRAENERHSNISLYHGDIPRTDPALIQTVEELGDEANGWAAKLRVVEIPDGVEWELDEYDGVESIHEKHQSWG